MRTADIIFPNGASILAEAELSVTEAPKQHAASYQNEWWKGPVRVRHYFLDVMNFLEMSAQEDKNLKIAMEKIKTVGIVVKLEEHVTTHKNGETKEKEHIKLQVVDLER